MSEEWNEEFLRKEFELVRHEMDESVKESRSLERYALTLTGGIWAWLAVSKAEYHISFPAAAWLPALLVAFFFFRAAVISQHVKDIGDHLIEIEKAFQVPETLGWEQMYKKCYGKFKRASVYIFWFILLLVTIVIPVFFFR